MKIISTICILICILCGGLLWYYMPQRSMERAMELCMGTMCELTLVDGNMMRRAQARDEAFLLLHDIEKRMSIYNSESEVSRINRGEKTPVSVSVDTFTVIEKSLYFSHLTSGAFDITTLPLSELWGFKKHEPHVPSQEEITQCLQQVGSDAIAVSQSGDQRSVQIMKEGVRIDLGGIAKGYACDAVVELLKKRGVPSAMVNIGGTIYAYGKTVHHTAWKIGLRDPRSKHAVRYSVILDDAAIATSGDYEQFFVDKGKRYTHIINPRTGMPVEGVLAVSIIAPHAVTADALSTAVFVMGPDEGISFVNKVQNVHACMMYEQKGGVREIFSRDFPLTN